MAVDEFTTGTRSDLLNENMVRTQDLIMKSERPTPCIQTGCNYESVSEQFFCEDHCSGRIYLSTPPGKNNY